MIDFEKIEKTTKQSRQFKYALLGLLVLVGIYFYFFIDSSYAAEISIVTLLTLLIIEMRYANEMTQVALNSLKNHSDTIEHCKKLFEAYRQEL